MTIKDIVEEKMFNKWWFINSVEPKFVYLYKWNEYGETKMYCVYQTYESFLEYKMPETDEKKIWCWGDSEISLFEDVVRDFKEVTGPNLDFLEKELAKHLLAKE